MTLEGDHEACISDGGTGDSFADNRRVDRSFYSARHRFSRLNASSQISIDCRGCAKTKAAFVPIGPRALVAWENRSVFHGELQKDQTSDALYHPNFIFVGLFACAGISMEFFRDCDRSVR